jgi:hypothetical protein
LGRKITLAMDKRRTFKELTEVSLTRAIEAQGFVIPSNAAGVVLAAYADGLAYEAEFESPRHVVLTLEAEDIRLVNTFRMRSAEHQQRGLPA